MALLNYANQFAEILENNLLPEDNRLIFTGDKHIITHGVDYLADYDGTRGLVPSYITSETLDDFGVLGKEGWKKITTDMLPIAGDLTANGNDSIFTSLQVQNLIKNGFAANDAMVFKGVLVKSQDKLQNISNAFADVPTKGYSAGWTYRVAEAGDYLETKPCEVGDWIIATNDRAEPTVNAGGEQITKSDWSIIQTNIDGLATITLNGIEYIFATNKNQNTSIKLYAPDSKGLSGQILSMGTVKGSDGEFPLIWIDQSSITAGDSSKLGGKPATDFVNDVSVSNEGKLIVTHGLNSSSPDIIAKKLLKGLKAGPGLGLATIADDIITIVENASFDGSTDYTMLLRPASTTTLGGVQIGTGIEVDGNGVISLKKETLVDILGKDFSSIANTAVVSTTSNGLAPQIENAIKQLPSTLQILGYDPTNTSKTEPGWYEIPGAALTNTWREIQINSVSIGDRKLNIMPSEDIHFIKDEETSQDRCDIKFGISWYNITTKEFETI